MSIDIQMILWIVTAFSVITFLVFFLALREEIFYSVRRASPARKKGGIRPPPGKPFAVWGIFTVLGLISLAGVSLIAAGYGIEPQTSGPVFIAPPSPVPTQTSQPVVDDLAPVAIALGFPADVNPCTSDILTLIPEDVDPYLLPVIYPIDTWFQRRQFVRDAFAEIRVTNQAAGGEISVSEKIMLQVVSYTPLPGPVSAAFSLCETITPVAYPTLQINSSTGLTEISAREQPVSLRPGQSDRRSISISGMEPGLYEVRLGVEYVMQGISQQIWSEETITVQTPGIIHRWSAGVITYWGECEFDQGSYRCDETELDEPVLVDSEPAQQGTTGGTVVEICRIAPENRLTVGGTAEVSRRIGLRLRVREEPGLEGPIITSMSRGTQVVVENGPVCKDNYWWWKVDIPSAGINGWMAEAEPRLYYLDPTN